MRFVHLLVSAEGRDAVLAALSEASIDYVVTETESEGGEFLVQFPVPTQAVVADSVGVVVTEQSAVENRTTGAVQSVLDRPAYERLELLGVDVGFGGFLRQDRTVTVSVRRPADVDFPGLAADLRHRIAEATGHDTTVVVEFVERRRSGASEQ